MNTQVTQLADHQTSLCNRADEIIGLAIRLKAKLKGALNLPLPDDATDDLIRHLAIFVAESERHPR